MNTFDETYGMRLIEPQILWSGLVLVEIPLPIRTALRVTGPFSYPDLGMERWEAPTSVIVNAIPLSSFSGFMRMKSHFSSSLLSKYRKALVGMRESTISYSKRGFTALSSSSHDT
ncbi:MAG: hypothetical protein QXP68_04250 [Thermosphaera sp.]